MGLVYWPQLAPLCEPARGLVDLVELEPQIFWRQASARDLALDRRALAAAADLPCPKAIHSAFAPVGGAHVRSELLDALAFAVACVDPLWVSEHCSFNQAVLDERGTYTSFLLPPLQDEAGVAVASANLQRLRARVDRPVSFETGVNYLRRGSGELSDGAFWRAIAEAADCDILLDLHNVWANAQNGRDSVERVLSELPLERVTEIHMAGGVPRDGYWLDAHSGPSPDRLKGILADLLPDLPRLAAITFEIMPDHVDRIGLHAVATELEALQRLWRDRTVPVAVPARTCSAPIVTPSPEALERVAAWETAVAAQVLRRALPGEDPGFALLAAEVEDFRAGVAARNLTLSLRLMHIDLGAVRVRELLEGFWMAQGPAMFPADEALALADHIAAHAPPDPALHSLLALECAIIRAQCEGRDATVAFPFEPGPFLADLRGGLSPRRLWPGDYLVDIAASDWR